MQQIFPYLELNLCNFDYDIPVNKHLSSFQVPVMFHISTFVQITTYEIRSPNNYPKIQTDLNLTNVKLKLRCKYHFLEKFLRFINQKVISNHCINFKDASSFSTLVASSSYIFIQNVFMNFVLIQTNDSLPENVHWFTILNAKHFCYKVSD